MKYVSLVLFIHSFLLLHQIHLNVQLLFYQMNNQEQCNDLMIIAMLLIISIKYLDYLDL